MALSKQTEMEIYRKAKAGEPLTGNNPEARTIYNRLRDQFARVAANLAGKTKEQGAGSTPSTPAVIISTIVGQPPADLYSGSARSAREKQMQEFKGWDNNPEVLNLQVKSWQIYVDTGLWNTAAQQEFYRQAEEIRKYNNPMYPGMPWGPKNPGDANKITPPGTTPGADTIEGGLDSVIDPTKWGGYLKAGIGVVFVFMLFSLFRR